MFNRLPLWKGTGMSWNCHQIMLVPTIGPENLPVRKLYNLQVGGAQGSGNAINIVIEHELNIY